MVMPTSNVLAGRYELRSRLGRGGMAEVFRAYDRRLDREVAVKVLANHLLTDPRSIDRFEREGRAAASLNHPNIINVYDAASEGDTHYIVMELVEGDTLADVIQREGPLPVDRALRLAGRVADALQAAHARGLVHYDVKPSNVLFDEDGNVKVADFGIARAASSDVTTIQGSPPYVAPEQARGGQADPRSDIYALGCVLFEMLAGRPPFQGDTASSVIVQHLNTAPPRLSELRDDLPPGIDTVVARALAKDADQRYPSAAEFRADLDRIAGGQSVGTTAILSTRHLEPGATVPMGRDDTIVYQAADEYEPPRDPTRAYEPVYDDEPRRERWRPSATAVAITIAVVLLAILGLVALTDNQLRDDDPGAVAVAPSEPEPEPQPEAEQDQDPQPEPDPEPDDAAPGPGDRVRDSVRDLVDRGQDAAGDARDRAVEELQSELADAVDRQADNANEELAGRIDELRDEIDRLTDADQIGEGVADRLRRLIDEVNPFGG